MLFGGEVEATPVSALDVVCNSVPLFPSRYCQSDRLSRLAWDLFGQIENPHKKVVAIADWIHDNVGVPAGQHRLDDLGVRHGDPTHRRVPRLRPPRHRVVPRAQHPGALLRRLRLPARSARLSACFECFIGGSWVVFDATRLAPLNGLVRMGTGRDAADAAVASMFGSIKPVAHTVNCSLAEGQTFTPLNRKQLDRRGVALEPAV